MTWHPCLRDLEDDLASKWLITPLQAVPQGNRATCPRHVRSWNKGSNFIHNLCERIWKISSPNTIFLWEGACSVSHCWLRAAWKLPKASELLLFQWRCSLAGATGSHHPGVSVFTGVDRFATTWTEQMLPVYLLGAGHCPGQWWEWRGEEWSPLICRERSPVLTFQSASTYWALAMYGAYHHIFLYCYPLILTRIPLGGYYCAVTVMIPFSPMRLFG